MSWVSRKICWYKLFPKLFSQIARLPYNLFINQSDALRSAKRAIWFVAISARFAAKKRRGTAIGSSLRVAKHVKVNCKLLKKIPSDAFQNIFLVSNFSTQGHSCNFSRLPTFICVGAPTSNPEEDAAKVLSTFDKAGTIKEVELVYETLSSSFSTAKKQVVKESLGFASKPSGVSQKQVIVEEDAMVKRFKKLAGLL
jgi:hypothetical protein